MDSKMGTKWPAMAPEKWRPPSTGRPGADLVTAANTVGQIVEALARPASWDPHETTCVVSWLRKWSTVLVERWEPVAPAALQAIVEARLPVPMTIGEVAAPTGIDALQRVAIRMVNWAELEEPGTPEQTTAVQARVNAETARAIVARVEAELRILEKAGVLRDVVPPEFDVPTSMVVAEFGIPRNRLEEARLSGAITGVQAKTGKREWHYRRADVEDLAQKVRTEKPKQRQKRKAATRRAEETDRRRVDRAARRA